MCERPRASHDGVAVTARETQWRAVRMRFGATSAPLQSVMCEGLSAIVVAIATTPEEDSCSTSAHARCVGSLLPLHAARAEDGECARRQRDEREGPRGAVVARVRASPVVLEKLEMGCFVMSVSRERKQSTLPLASQQWCTIAIGVRERFTTI